MGAKSRRCHYLIDPRFQISHIVGFAMFGLVVSLIVAGVVALLFLLKLPGTRAEQMLFGAEFFADILWVILALVAASCAWAVLLSHRVVGPMFRLKQVMRTVGEGDLTYQVRFRARDRLKDVAAAFDEMTGKLRDLVSADRTTAIHVSETARQAIEMLNGAELSSEQIRELRSMLTDMATSANTIAAKFKTEQQHSDPIPKA
jgi:methyl-accepting chemotaxis protein